MKVSLEEMETHLNMTADDRGLWHGFSNDPVWQRRWEDAGAIIVKISPDGKSKWYTMTSRQVKFRREMTEEKRRQQAERFRQYRQSTKVPQLDTL